MPSKIRKGDRVHVLTGKDEGKQGKVIAVFPKDNRVLVQGVNRVTRHEKIRPGRGRASQEGGLTTKELPVDLSNVTLVCQNCGPTRVGFRVEDDGSRVRVCRSCEGEV